MKYKENYIINVGFNFFLVERGINQTMRTGAVSRPYLVIPRSTDKI